MDFAVQAATVNSTHLHENKRLNERSNQYGYPPEGVPPGGRVRLFNGQKKSICP